MNTICFFATKDHSKSSVLHLSCWPWYRRSSVRCAIIISVLFFYPWVAWAGITCQNGKVTVSGTVRSPVTPGYGCSSTGVSVQSVTIASNAHITVTGDTKAITLAQGVKLDIQSGANVESKGSTHTTHGHDGLLLQGGSIVNIDGQVVSNDTGSLSRGQNPNSEAIVIQGNGNTITVGETGVLQTSRGVVLYFMHRNAGQQNTLINHGLIQAGADGQGTFASFSEGLKFNFTNATGGKVYGKLSLGRGNDTITLEQGSVFKGKIYTHSGNDSITIANGAQFDSIDAGSDANRKDTLNLIGDDTTKTWLLSGTVKNIDILNKKGSGTWGIDDKLTLSDSAQVNVEAGTLTFKKAQTYTGTTLVSSGATLQAAAKNVFSADSAHTVASGATLGLNGFDQTLQSLVNEGTIALGSKQKKQHAQLTVTGNYQGGTTDQPGLLQFYTVLGDDSSSSDKMVVGGDVSGKTTIEVINDAGLGAQTTGNGIQVVAVTGNSPDDAFSLPGGKQGHVDVGAYQYYLGKGSDSSTSRNWYLRSNRKPTPKTQPTPKTATVPGKKTAAQAKPVAEPIPTYRQEVPIYAGLPAQLRQASLSLIGNLQQRIGEAPSGPERQLWVRLIRKNITIDQNGVADVSSKGHSSGFQIGSDLWSRNGLSVGSYVGYVRSKINFSGFASGKHERAGSATTHSYALGAYATHTWTDASYLDLVVQGTQHNADLRTEENHGSAEHKNKALTLSLEAGKSFALGSSHWRVVPQVQAVQQWLHMRDADLSGRTTVSQKHTHSVLLRTGISAQGQYTLGRHRFSPYAKANLYYSPSGADRVSFTTRTTNTTLTSGVRHYDKEVAFGTSLGLTKTVTAYGEVGRIWSDGPARIKPAGGVFLGIRAAW